MKSMGALVLILLVSSFMFAQNSRPLKMNLLDYFDKVPVPPATCKQAHEKCDCNIPGYDAMCKADRIFKSLDDELMKLSTEANTPPDAAQTDMMKKMQDPEFQKKVQHMSNEEKMKLAMELQQGMTPTMKVESDDVLAALKEFSDLNQARANEIAGMQKGLEAQQKEAETLRAKHQAVDDWMAAEITKLPLLSSGEMSYRDPKAVYAVTMNAHKKHIAIADEQLKMAGKRWADEKTSVRKHYMPFETKLEKIHFGDDAANASTKSQLAMGQMMIIGSVQGLMAESKNAFDEAANRYERMVFYEKQNKP